MKAVDLDSLTRAEVERVAAAVLREVAKGSYSRHRNVVTASREASQMTHLAFVLERYADA